MRRSSFLAIALLLACGTLRAGTLHVTVRDNRGAPVKDAIVYALPAGGKPPAVRKPAIVTQRDQQFIPHVTAIETGSAVQFPNQDGVKHHVYSFSPAKKFELPLYAGTPASPIVFDKPGVVTLGCNIHDWMIAYILVVPTPWFAITRDDGAARFTLPDGPYDIEVWQPRLRDANARPRQRVSVGADSTSTFQLDLKPELRLRRSPSDTGDTYR